MARRTIRARRSSPYLIALVIIFAVLFVAAAIGWGWTWNTRNEELALTFGQQFVDRCAQTEKNPIAEVRSMYGDPGTPSATIVDIIKFHKDQADAYRSDIPRLTQPLTGDVPSSQGEAAARGRVAGGPDGPGLPGRRRQDADHQLRGDARRRQGRRRQAAEHGRRGAVPRASASTRSSCRSRPTPRPPRTWRPN